LSFGISPVSVIVTIMTLTADDIEALSAGAAKSPAALFKAIADVAVRRVDAGLVTAMRHDEPAATVERLYSSNPQAYAVGGRKLKQDSDWSRYVLVEHRVLVSAGDDDIREFYADHAQIFGLGLHSCVNIPLVRDGKCIGTLNVLRAQPDWSKDEVALVRALGLAALAAVLMMNA
jgi:GAF domain-containing protein